MVVLLFATVLGAVVFAGEEPAEESERPVLEIKMISENWRWIPDTIRVKKGTLVVLKIHSRNATHAFKLKEYGLKVSLPQGKTTTVEFVADKAGTFTWRCGRPCGNGCAKMRGTMTVLEPVE
jgi:cytochrome c oxidase subunit 2